MHEETKCHSCPLRQLSSFANKSTEVLDYIQSFKVGEIQIAAGATLFAQGTATSHFYTVLEGCGFKQQVLPDGARQVLSFVVPGDLIGLQSAIADDIDHSVEAATGMRLCLFSKDRLYELLENQAELAFDLIWLVAREETSLHSLLSNMGQRNAKERVAFLLMHFAARWLRHKDLTPSDRLDLAFPYTQEIIGDALGITSVHTSRSLGALSREGILSLKRRRLNVRDWWAAEQLVGWDREVHNPSTRVLL